MGWEYKIVFLISDAAADEEQYEQRLHNNLGILNDLGSEGWELVGFLPHMSNSRLNRYHAVMKRLQSL